MADAVGASPVAAPPAAGPAPWAQAGGDGLRGPVRWTHGRRPRSDRRVTQVWEPPAPRSRPLPGPLRLVILDCDGVLVDSERIAARVDAAVLAVLGWPLSVDEVIERFMGRTEAACIAEVEAHLGRRPPPGWDAEYQPWYRDAFAAELAPVPGVLEALDQITTPTCIASNGAHDKIRYTLGLTGLYERFAGRIFSAEDVAQGKPAPDLFLHAAARFGAPPAACAVVEDSRPGVEAARAAGMRVFGYAGVTPARHLRGPGTVLFGDMRELPRLLGEP